MLYQVFCLVLINENGTILMNLLGGYFSPNNSNLSKKIELTFYWLDIHWLSISSSKYTDCNQRWSPRERPWPRGCPRGHILKSLALASRPQVLENWPVLGSRTALFFGMLKFSGALEKFFGKRFLVEIA